MCACFLHRCMRLLCRHLAHAHTETHARVRACMQCIHSHARTHVHAHAHTHPLRPMCQQDLEERGVAGEHVALQLGEMSLHHIRLAHRSGPAAPGAADLRMSTFAALASR